MVALLADDPLGRTRDAVDDDLGPYRRALAAIEVDPAQLVVVAADVVVGTLQLTTDRTRTAAHRFHDRLGFSASHEGDELAL